MAPINVKSELPVDSESDPDNSCKRGEKIGVLTSTDLIDTNMNHIIYWKTNQPTTECLYSEEFKKKKLYFLERTGNGIKFVLFSDIFRFFDFSKHNEKKVFEKCLIRIYEKSK